jgi:hypothetical protein
MLDPRLDSLLLSLQDQQVRNRLQLSGAVFPQFARAEFASVEQGASNLPAVTLSILPVPSQ